MMRLRRQSIPRRRTVTSLSPLKVPQVGDKVLAPYNGGDEYAAEVVKVFHPPGSELCVDVVFYDKDVGKKIPARLLNYNREAAGTTSQKSFFETSRPRYRSRYAEGADHDSEDEEEDGKSESAPSSSMVMIDRVALLGATDPVHARKVQRGQSVGERFGEYIRGTQPPQFDYRLTSKEDLNVLTTGFFLGTGDWGGLKKEDGTAYQPDYVRGLRNMLNTYLAARWKGPLGTIPSPLLLNKNKQFTKGPLNLTSAMKDIVKTARADPVARKNGYGTKPNKAGTLSREGERDINKSCDLLNPLHRRWLVYKAVTTGFGTRGGEPTHLCVAAFTRGEDEHGRKKIDYDPEHTKQHGYNPDSNCDSEPPKPKTIFKNSEDPLSYYNLINDYLLDMPVDHMGRFFVKSFEESGGSDAARNEMNVRSTEENVTGTDARSKFNVKMVIGKGKLRTYYRDMGEYAGVENYETLKAHTGRKNSASRVHNDGQKLSSLQKREATGHKSEAGAAYYEETSSTVKAQRAAIIELGPAAGDAVRDGADLRDHANLPSSMSAHSALGKRPAEDMGFASMMGPPASMGYPGFHPAMMSPHAAMSFPSMMGHPASMGYPGFHPAMMSPHAAVGFPSMMGPPASMGYPGYHPAMMSPHAAMGFPPMHPSMMHMYPGGVPSEKPKKRKKQASPRVPATPEDESSSDGVEAGSDEDGF